MPASQLRYGPYLVPRYEHDAVVMDEAYGLVKIAGTSGAEMAWPLHIDPGGHRVPVLFRDLVQGLAEL